MAKAPPKMLLPARGAPRPRSSGRPAMPPGAMLSTSDAPASPTPFKTGGKVGSGKKRGC